MFNVSTLFSSALFATAAQASFHMGGCPAFETMGADFDVNRYTGHWFEVVKDKYTFFEIGAGCVQADYGLNDDGSLSVKNSAHRFFFGWSSIEGSGVESNVTGPGTFNVNLHGEPSADKAGNYNVIDTDYDTYTVVYSCKEKFGGLISTDYFWILAREQTLSDAALVDIIKVVEEKLPGYNFFENHSMGRQGWTCPYDNMPKTEANFTQ